MPVNAATFELPLDFAGTDFQKSLAGLAEYSGQTRSYREIAEQVGNVKAAVRAVGAANGKTRFRLLHLVIG